MGAGLMKLIERKNGFFHLEFKEDGKLIKSAPFEKDSDQWSELIEEGCEVEYLPQAEKDEYQAQQDRESVIIQITSLESKQTPRKLREAALGDVEAIKFLQDLENEIAELRKQL